MKDNSNSGRQPHSLDQLLLSAARSEEPSPELDQRMMAPLLVVPTLPPPLGAPEVAATSSKAVGLAWTALAVGGLSLAGAVAWFAFSAEAPRGIPPSGARSEAVAQQSVVSEEEASATEAEGPKSSRQNGAALPAEPTPTPTPTHKVVTPSPTPKERSTLNEEMRLLDQARAALAQDDQQRALAILSQYEQKYPRGVLKPEATVLRVSALSAAGQAEQADDLKKDFLDQHPTSAHRQRLENDVESPR